MTQPISNRADKLYLDCPTCGVKGFEPCRVRSHRHERERPDHAARKKTASRKALGNGETL